MRSLIRTSLPFFPIVALLGILGRGWATYSGALLLVGICIGVDLWLRESHGDDESVDATGELTLRLYLFAQIAVVAFVVWWVPRQGMKPYEWIGSCLSVALITGTLGTLIAHEYIHRARRKERILGTIAFGAVNYAHFHLSHVHGHHPRVGLSDDWSTARRGETAYAFVLRAVVDGWLGAWKLEKRRLLRRGERVFTWHNEMVVITASQVSLLALVSLLGARHLVLFLTVSVVSFSITELVNYLGHYGLTREAHEPIRAEHSWESAHKLTNWLLLEAGKHCDHHLQPGRHHSGLKLRSPRPAIPYGVPSLLLMALVPPVFFRVMHSYLDEPDEAATRPCAG